jgi:hypothetical protein
MKITKQDVISYVVPAISGIIIGLCMVKCASKPVDNIKIERDTVVVVDTAYYDRPVPKDSVRTRYVTRWLPVVRTDTVTKWDYITMTDTVAVEVPITSKHYGGDTYDAWVSGYEPSLDSIRVYQRTAYVTEVRTISKPPNKWELDIVGGIDYGIKTQQYRPFAGGELMYKPSRLQLGIRGGVVKQGNKAEPQVGAVVKYRLF